MSKLLVVDDDERLRRLMSIELGDTYEVIGTGEPENGLALALEHRPDAILLDLRMPKYSGYELCQTFTSFSRTQSIPVVIVSGEGGAQTKEYCKQLGATEFFEKPVDMVELRACLNRVIKSRLYVPRSEVRVRLHVPLKLRGTSQQGVVIEETVTTENVSLNGFLFLSAKDLPVQSVVEVSMIKGREEYVGKAMIMHAEGQPGSVRHYGCRFTEKTGPWILQ